MNRQDIYRRMPPVKGVTELITASGTTNDIVKAVISKFNESKNQSCQIAPSFAKRTLPETLRTIHSWIRSNIKYKEDKEGTQVTKSPSATVFTGIADCKSMAILSGSILWCLGIPFSFRLAKYLNSDNPSQFSHIYIIVPTGDGKYITLDPTLLTFNYEAQGWSGSPKDYYIPALRQAPGLANTRASVNGVRQRPAQVGGFWDRVKEGAEKIFQGVKTVGVSPARAAYLVLIRFNVRGWATVLAEGIKDAAFSKKIHDKWYSLGGNFTELKSAINAGKNKKPLMGTNDKIGYSGMDIGIGSAAAVSTFLTTASAIIAAMAPIILGVIAMIQQKQAAKQQGSGTTTDPNGGNTNTMSTTIIPIAIAALVGLALTYATSTK